MPRRVTIDGETLTEADLDCPECGAFMVLDKRGGKLYYRCSTAKWSKCSGTHSCHTDGRPLGIPGDAPTKAARMKAHRAFDQLWKSGRMSRSGAYHFMQGLMRMSSAEAHIGRFTIEQCEELLALLERNGITPPEDIIKDGEGFVELGFGER